MARVLSDDGLVIVKNTFIDVRDTASTGIRKRSRSVDHVEKLLEETQQALANATAAAQDDSVDPGRQGALPRAEVPTDEVMPVEDLLAITRIKNTFLDVDVACEGRTRCRRRSKSMDASVPGMQAMMFPIEDDEDEDSMMRADLADRVLQRACAKSVTQDAKLETAPSSRGDLLANLRGCLAEAGAPDDRQMLLDLMVVAASLGNSGALPAAMAYAVNVHFSRLWTRCSEDVRRLVEILQQMVMGAASQHAADVEGILSIIILTEEIRELVPEKGRNSYTAALRVLRDIATARCVCAAGHRDRDLYVHCLEQASGDMPNSAKDHLVEKMMNSFEKMVYCHETGAFRSKNKGQHSKAEGSFDHREPPKARRPRNRKGGKKRL